MGSAEVLVIPLDVLTTAVIPGRPQESISFSQLKNPIGLHCDYFVSHSWSHPFAKTLVALDCCAKCCQAEVPKVAFWICLFALYLAPVAVLFGVSYQIGDL